MSRTWSRLAKAGFVLVALVIGKELAAALPEQSVTLRAFEVPGDLEGPVELRTAAVEVLDVQLAPTVLTPTAGHRTPGLWVVVTARLTPAEEKKTFAYAAVRSADGARVWEGRSPGQPDVPGAAPGRAGHL